MGAPHGFENGFDGSPEWLYMTLEKDFLTAVRKRGLAVNRVDSRIVAKRRLAWCLARFSNLRMPFSRGILLACHFPNLEWPLRTDSMAL